MVTDQISRRGVLALGSLVLGGMAVRDVQALTTQQAIDDIDGWVPKGSKTEIDEQEARIAEIHEPSSTFCTTGEFYTCKPPAGDEFGLIVEFGTPQPSVGDTYEFTLTGKENFCGNFQVELVEMPADTTTDTTAETTTTETTTTETTTETTTDTTTTNTTDTTTNTTDTTTETTTTDTTSDTTTDTTTAETTTDTSTRNITDS